MSVVRNPWTRWQSLVPSDPLRVGEVLSHGADGTSRVRLAGGTETEAQGTDVAVGSLAWVRGGKIVGAAPPLPTIQIEL